MNSSVDELFEKLSWSNPEDIQKQGICEARKIRHLSVFLQPLESKSVWENCAKVLIEKDDNQLERYLIPLFEWLQDMNWPGASLISERLSKMPKDILRFAYEVSYEKAVQTKDDCWKHNLLVFWNEC